jgi:hypothetical protein
MQIIRPAINLSILYKDLDWWVCDDNSSFYEIFEIV